MDGIIHTGLVGGSGPLETWWGFLGLVGLVALIGQFMVALKRGSVTGVLALAVVAFICSGARLAVEVHGALYKYANSEEVLRGEVGNFVVWTTICAVFTILHLSIALLRRRNIGDRNTGGVGAERSSSSTAPM